MKHRILFGVSLALMLAALYMVLIYVPTDAEMGIIQRIFYFHVPLAWIALLAFFLVFVGSILYLRKREKRWDFFASAAAEVGIIFTTLFLITGSIWAKPIWGVWWTWDARLTTSLVLWLIYIAYFVVRSYIAESERRARFAAVIGITGFLDVPVVILAIILSRTQHPGALIFQGGLAPPMSLTLMVCIAAFTVFFILILWERMSMKYAEDGVTRLKELVRR